MLRRLLLTRLLLIAAWCGLAGAASAEQPVDFQRDIWPLLESRCVKCHGSDKVKGGLRLDSRQGADLGGHLGQSLLREPAATNDLLRRIATADPSERMPLEGTPLSAAEVSLVTRWIEQGAKWPDPNNQQPPIRYAQPPQPLFDRLFTLVEETRPAWYAGLASMIALLLLQRARLRQARQPQDRGWTAALARVPRLLTLVGALLAVIWGMAMQMQLHQGQLRALEQQLLATRVSKVNTAEPPTPRQLFAGHPPRLGGEYYRGNDERSPRLFNGGFYRTATLNVHLIDSQGLPCQWDDAYPDAPRIELTIERAPQATPNLFTDRIISKVFFTPVRPTDLPAARNVDYRELEVLTAGEKWKVDFLLASCGTSGRVSGDLFLYAERSLFEGKLTGYPHFRIDYDLQIQDGKIQRQSRIDLVALVLPGNVVSAQPEKILPSEWFDFRPIPVIEGEPATDPDLLGITEHLRTDRNAPSE